MSDDVTYYNQMLWVHSDKLISSSNLSLDKFVAKDNWGISPPKLRLSINHYKSKSVSQITLSNQEVFVFIQNFKKFEGRICDFSKEMEEDHNKQHTFSVRNKKNIFVTFLFRNEYNGACVRIVISEKNNDYLDSEKVYLSIYDFLSLVSVIGQFRNNYLQTIDSMSAVIAINELDKKIQKMDDKLTGYYSEFLAKSKLLENEIKIQSQNLPREYNPLSDLDKMPLESKLDIINESIIEENKASSSSATKPDQASTEVIHDDMSDFIQKKRDTFDIGIDLTETEKPKAETVLANVMPLTFTEKMLSNDLANLEMYFMNLVNDDLPVSKFSSLVKNKLSFDPLEGVRPDDENATDYLTSLFLKTVIKNGIDGKTKHEIPASVPPIVFDNVNSNENKISLAYDLYLYCIYYSYLRNILKDKDYNVVANKELMTFSLKLISSPFVFSLIKNIDEKVLIAELLNRYRKYRSSGVFNNIEKSIIDTRSIEVNLTEETIKTEAKRIYSVVIQRWNSLTIEGTFQERKCVLKLDDFRKNKLSKEQIKKILAAEFNYTKNKKVDFKEAGINGFDDIPLTIAEKYGITKQKFDNTNLKRFVKEKCKDNQDLLKKCTDVVDLINESFKDLKDKNVDYSIIPEEILKAVVIWDLKVDSKLASSYIHLLDQIQKCTLTRDMIISMLLNISNASDENFTKSFLSARDE